MNLIKKLPIPIAGLGLGLAALGNLIVSYHPMLRSVMGILSGIITILFTLKIIFFWDAIRDDLKNPISATVFGTYSMSLMLLSTYLKPIVGNVSIVLWYFGIILQFIIATYVLYAFFMKGFSIQKIFPSYFIPFVGLAVASVTAPAFEKLNIGQLLFWIAMVCYILLLPICLYRTYKVKNMPPPSVPTIAIFAAPGGLLLAGYMSSFPEKNMMLVNVLLAFCIGLYLLVMVQMPRLLNREFSPAFASFTFSLVISAIGVKLTNGFFMKSGNPIVILLYLTKAMELIAVIFVFYVLIKFIGFLTAK